MRYRSDIRCLPFQDGKYCAPYKCGGCKTRTMQPKRTDADSVDWQQLAVQEIVENRSSGRVPRTIECEATGAMVDRAVPGDVVCVSGIVKVLAAGEWAALASISLCIDLSTFCLVCISVVLVANARCRRT